MHVKMANDLDRGTVGDADEQSAPAAWAADMLEALEELDRVDRAALRLIYTIGMSQAQVAWELGLPESEVRRSVARGMHKLAARLTTRTAAPA